MEQKKQMNYTIEFIRIMFALNFMAVHALLVIPQAFLGGPPLYVVGLDTIMPFMLFAGFFLMQAYRKEQQTAAANDGADKRAWGYLKARLIGLYPAFFLAQLLGFIGLNLWKATPLINWPIGLLNHAGEFLGLQITGIGFGNAFVGEWGKLGRVLQLLNSPLWFISGIFICGPLVYFLLCKSEKAFLGFIAPLATLLFYGDAYLRNLNPIWYNFDKSGDFWVNQSFTHMFVGLSLGCLVYVAVEALKGKQWTRGAVVFLTIVNVILGVLVIGRTWLDLRSPIMVATNVSWGSVHLLSIIFTFLVLLNVDGFTKALNWKIWAVPGRMAMYVYMFHFPIIVMTALAMGVTDKTKFTQMPVVLAVAVVVVLLFSYGFMQLQNKVIAPWIKSNPWFKKAEDAQAPAKA
jgi:peptidoglycan/LPS O-acetylase OafA/YrhL